MTIIQEVNVKSSPFIHLSPSLQQLMWRINFTLLPALIFVAYLHGTRIFANALVLIISAIILEALVLLIRKKNLRPIFDGSAVLSALLLTLSLPISAPIHVLLLASFIAIILGKQLFGGLGMNIFNPAMLAYVFCLISFPLSMSLHIENNLTFNSLWIDNLDATSSATPLSLAREMRLNGKKEALIFNWQNYLLHFYYFCAGIYLAKKRFLDFRISLAVFGGAILSASLFQLNGANLNVWQQLNSGAIIFGAIYIATDPVSASTTVIGRWIYGFLIGFLCICIRELGQFPDGFAFAVLFANSLAPLLDFYTAPKYR